MLFIEAKIKKPKWLANERNPQAKIQKLQVFG